MAIIRINLTFVKFIHYKPYFKTEFQSALFLFTIKNLKNLPNSHIDMCYVNIAMGTRKLTDTFKSILKETNI